MKITEKEFNVQTGKETITERDETDAEKSAREKREAEMLAIQKAEAARAIQKAAIIAKLGLTADEFATLL